MGNLRDREVACSASFVNPQKVTLAQFGRCVHKGGLKFSLLNCLTVEVVGRVKWKEITHICLIWDQLFANLDVLNIHFIVDSIDLIGQQNTYGRA